MDAQEQHNLHLEEAKLTPGSKQRVEALLQGSESSSSEDSPRSTQDPLAAASARSGATREELVEEAEAMGF